MEVAGIGITYCMAFAECGEVDSFVSSVTAKVAVRARPEASMTASLDAPPPLARVIHSPECAVSLSPSCLSCAVRVVSCVRECPLHAPYVVLSSSSKSRFLEPPNTLDELSEWWRRTTMTVGGEVRRARIRGRQAKRCRDGRENTNQLDGSKVSARSRSRLSEEASHGPSASSTTMHGETTAC